jgi:putative dimethyl sulfoxide reductase chaperone
MKFDQCIRFAQIYRFLLDAVRSPEENWLNDLDVLNRTLVELDLPTLELDASGWDQASLQAEHRRVFGLTGSLCYETEYGLPHEFRQSQELADISGFYQAFGFKVGGKLRERPDHILVELEFMYLLCLKEALAHTEGHQARVEICSEAQKRFITDHLGRWVALFSQAVEKNSFQPLPVKGDIPYRLSPYRELALFASGFVLAHARFVGAEPDILSKAEVKPTPLGLDMSCGGCEAQGAGL